MTVFDKDEAVNLHALPKIHRLLPGGHDIELRITILSLDLDELPERISHVLDLIERIGRTDASLEESNQHFADVTDL
jgi:hypothetical protein